MRNSIPDDKAMMVEDEDDIYREGERGGEHQRVEGRDVPPGFQLPFQQIPLLEVPPLWMIFLELFKGMRQGERKGIGS